MGPKTDMEESYQSVLVKYGLMARYWKHNLREHLGFMLNVQFRQIPKAAAATANGFYNGRLENGLPRDSELNLSDHQLSRHGGFSLWDSGDDERCFKVGEDDSDSSENTGHVILILAKLTEMECNGYTSETIVVLSSHSAQTWAMRVAVQNNPFLSRMKITCENIDTSQGRTVDITFISLVASSARASRGERCYKVPQEVADLDEFTADSGRFNVGTSRSRKMTVVLADRKFYTSCGLTWWKKYLGTCVALGVVCKTEKMYVGVGFGSCPSVSRPFHETL